MEMKCQHCGYEWDYGGKNKYYATCPFCHNLVSVRKNLAKSSSDGNGGISIKIQKMFEKVKKNKPTIEELLKIADDGEL